MDHDWLDQAQRFIFTDFQQRKPFSSFLPGIAGVTGSPMWVFYVNRGQAMAGFGVESKDAPIMEFQPANKAYQSTPLLGFRTFLKIERANAHECYEPFSQQHGAQAARQTMWIGANELEIEEDCSAQGIKTNVVYFTPPGETFASLARTLTLTNTSDVPLALDILDGLPALIPYGVNNFLLKELGRTCEAWMEVFNLPANASFYRLRASVVDRVEVETFEAGHFAFAFVKDASLLPALVDPVAVFGADTSFAYPQGFYDQTLEALLAAPQITCGRTPCGMFAHHAQLAPGQFLTIHSLYGHIGSLDLLTRHLPRLTHAAYFADKRAQAVALAEELTQSVVTVTADPVFDAYVRQNFLDNVLRGGMPILLGNDPSRKPYYIYSRKHGDLERDYNAFLIAPEPYSQGEGSYRDVNQNRRDNILQFPEIGDFDIRTFFSLIQVDGYNPRTVKGSVFSLPAAELDRLIAPLKDGETLRALLSKPFTPGKLLKAVLEREISLPASPEVFVNEVISRAEQRLEATFFEGFWIDHWEYNLDLIENYLAIFPERQDELLFGKADLPFFESPVTVQPRSKKYVLTGNGPRQIGSLLEDEDKACGMNARAAEKDWMRSDHGRGEVYKTNLFAKMTLVTLLKFASLDPFGMGIEMEASRPGWYDALNGLPALFGSGISETFELLRWVRFMRQAIQSHAVGEVKLPGELAQLLQHVIAQLNAYQTASAESRDFQYWDAVSSAREAYRAETRFGVGGAEQTLSLDDLSRAFQSFEIKLEDGIRRATQMNQGVPPTYFTYTMDEYDTLPEKDSSGRAYLRARRFTPHALPLFLEGPVRAYKVMDATSARVLYDRVKTSALFDEKLRMYKINANLEAEPPDIGRARAFPRGWLENESIWMHMEYKYLLEVLKAGLYADFFEDFRAQLVPFLDPQVYGRSTLENSSFLASSAHPDPSMHGEGFVARLTGSTAEFQSMWNIMMMGRQPFFMQDGKLSLALKPILPGWLFNEAGQVSFRFLSRCTVTYHNPHKRDTYHPECQIQRITLRANGQEMIEIIGNIIPASYAEQVRAGEIDTMDVTFG